ncbi:MAG: OadG family protein [Desulfovibrio sp.]
MNPPDMENVRAGLDNVLASGGPSLALAGMSVVFLALICISLFIAALPRLLLFWDALRPAREPEPAPTARVEVADGALAPNEEARAALMAVAVLVHDPGVAALLGLNLKTARTPEN